MFQIRITYLLLACFFAFPLSLTGQSDTVILELINVSQSISIREEPIGGQSNTWQTKAINNTGISTAADLLSGNGAFIKSYGSNNLATSSIRGGSAGHTLILWNDLPIQSPMLGLLDLSLLSLNAVDEISFQPGGNSALWGSGAIGGLIGLHNQATFDKGFSLSSHSIIGSFGDIQQQFNIRIGNPRMESVTKFSHHQADNDYHYPTAPNFPDRQQENAHISQQNIAQDFYFITKKKQQFSVHFWQQFSNREIPPTNTQNKSEAHQNDRASRFSAQWKHVLNKSVTKVKIGWFREHLDYFDDQIGLKANSQFQTVIGDINTEWGINHRQTLLIGLSQSHTSASANGYHKKPTENKSALFASHLFRLGNHKKWRIQSSIRQAFVDGHFIPLVPVFATDYALFSFLTIKAKISRNYRLATLNDRYWIPGGNEELKPESGWSEEGTLASHFRSKNKQILTKYSITGFNRKINNWILWTLLDGQSFWSANNITKVWSRGIEQRASISYKRKPFSLHFQLAYDFIRSTNQVTLSSPSIKKGEQLIYSPRHQAYAELMIRWKNFSLAYKHNYTGSSQGVNDFLPAHQTGNTRFSYKLIRNKWYSNFYFNINNIWDSRYVVVERRPMPGINFQLGVDFTIRPVD